MSTFNVSRDARDTLFLLAVLAWTAAPHLAHVPLWCAILTPLILLWRARMALHADPTPKRWVLFLGLVLGFTLTLWSYKTVLGKEAGVSMLVILISLKTLELRTRRDTFVVFYIGFFLVLTHFLFSQSILVGLAMLVSVWGLLTSLVLSHMPVGYPALGHAARLAGQITALGIPLMVLMFVFFPRIAPLWGVPQNSVFQTGLSDRLRMGTVSELVQSSEIVMRLKFFDPLPDLSSLYFRGPVLSQFDGREWSPLPRPSFAPEDTPRALVRPVGIGVRYEMTLEPQRLHEIPMLEASVSGPLQESISGRLWEAKFLDDLRWVAPFALTERVRLRSEAHTNFEHGPREAVLGLQDYVTLPPNSNPGTLAWAAALRRRPELLDADNQTLAQAVLQHIQTENFLYTLSPGLYENSDLNAVDEFWLKKKAGFCEHFATAFVVVMRALDIPARVVTGYQGVDPVPVDGYYIVRQNAAHAWAEFWQSGRGWVRVDPTAAVAPERITRSAILPTPRSLAVAQLEQAFGVQLELLTQLRNSWETLNNRWNQWVLNYSQEDQFQLLQRLGFEKLHWKKIAKICVFTFLGLGVLALLHKLWSHFRADPWARKMAGVRRTLRSMGVSIADHDPPLTLAHKTQLAFKEAAANLVGALRALDELRYGQGASARTLWPQFHTVRQQARQLQKNRRQQHHNRISKAM